MTYARSSGALMDVSPTPGAAPSQLETFVREAWSVGATIDLEGIDYGRIQWGNETDLMDCMLPYYPFLAGAARLIDAKTVLEIGTHWGGSARAMSRGMNGGKVVTVDLTTESDARLPFCRERESIVKLVGDANTPEMIREVQKHLTSVDMLYIDADHSMLPTLLNFTVYSTLLRPKIVLMDDIQLNDGMSYFWEIIRKAYPERSLNCVEVEPGIRNDGCGFGLVMLNP